MAIDLEKLTIRSAREHLNNGDFSAMELTESYLEEIGKKNPKINAYLEVFDDVMEQAKLADKMLQNGGGETPRLLTGIPIAIKDNILIKGRTASAASKILENYKAVYDATVIEKLKDNGAIFLGRTNMDEFAMGGSTENSAFGVTKNPADSSRVPGGSSGGSAAAVAMDGALGALGSDTGGSIRQPASFCGVIGLKPTYGSVSRHGLIAMASSLDQIGPFGKTVEDTEILFNAIKGKDKMDSTSSSEEYHDAGGIEKKEKLVIGVPYDFLGDGVDKDVLDNFNASLDALRDKGYEVRDISLPNAKYSLPVYYIIMPAESSTNLARFDGVRYGLYESGKNSIDDYAKTRGHSFGGEVRRRILLGTFVLSSGYYDAYYNKAIALRKLITDEFENVFDDVDIIATPTSPTPAFKIGEKSKDPLKMYLSDIFTVPANIVGIPAISVPSGFSEQDGNKLPLGVQFMAPHFGESLLFKTGKDMELILNSKYK
jgi:aspartyl-tRNA(Asn)/glutamyl-tRNA(Gln) amidotransferase subunit A